MIDSEIVLRKLGEVQRHVARARRRRGDDFEDLARDEDRQDALLLSVMVAVQEAIDCAYHLAVASKLGVPTSHADAFARLVEGGLLPEALGDTLADAARLRNRIAHGYASVDLERVWRELPVGLDALDAFASTIAATLQEPS